MNVFLLKHHGFEDVLHIEPFRLAGELGHFARVFFHGGHARIAIFVNAMAEAHDRAMLAQRSQHPFFRARGLADFKQHVHHGFVRTAMQRAFQRRDAADDAAVNIRHTRHDRARGERGGVETMLGVEHHRNFEGLDHFRRGHFAENHVEEILDEAQIIARRNKLLAFPQSIERREHGGNFRKQTDGTLQVRRGIGFVHLGVFHAKKTDGSSQHIHRMRGARRFLDDGEKILADAALATRRVCEGGEFFGRGQFTVPDEPGDFLEVTVLGQFLHRITTIHERIDLGHDLRDARGVHDHAVEAVMDRFRFFAHIGSS